MFWLMTGEKQRGGKGNSTGKIKGVVIPKRPSASYMNLLFKGAGRFRRVERRGGRMREKRGIKCGSH